MRCRQRTGTRSVTENELLAAVRQVAWHTGWLTYHTFRSDRSEPGFPDLCMVRDGRVVFAELKSEKGRVTRAQQMWLDALEGTGVEVFVWRPSDLDGIARVLSRRVS